MCIVGRFCRTNNDLKNQTEKARQSKEKGAKRIERKVRQQSTEREREREREREPERERESTSHNFIPSKAASIGVQKTLK
jgi:hypothetical protein